MSQRQPTSRAVRADLSRRIRADLRARGLSVADLARLIGRKKSAAAGVVAGGNTSAQARLRVELAMGAAYWSAPDELAGRRLVAAFYNGQHPRTLNLRRLDALAAKHLRPAGVRGRIRPRAALVVKLEAHAATATR